MQLHHVVHPSGLAERQSEQEGLSTGRATRRRRDRQTDTGGYEHLSELVAKYRFRRQRVSVCKLACGDAPEYRQNVSSLRGRHPRRAQQAARHSAQQTIEDNQVGQRQQPLAE